MRERIPLDDWSCLGGELSLSDRSLKSLTVPFISKGEIDRPGEM